MDSVEAVAADRSFRKGALLSRKFLGSLIVAILLTVALILAFATDNFSPEVFRIWTFALLADFGIYGAANVAQKFRGGQG